MTLDEIEEKLTYLLDREAIRDVVTTYCRAVDRLDRDLLLSAYHPDAIDDHAGFVGGREEFWDYVNDMHGKCHTVTQHSVTNHLAEIDGNVAHAETYFIYAALNRDGQPFSLVGGRYIDKLEKRDGAWAILERCMVPDWIAPSINTVEGSQTPEGRPNRLNIKPLHIKAMEGMAKSARDHSDPSYMRPLAIPERRRSEYLEARRLLDV